MGEVQTRQAFRIVDIRRARSELFWIEGDLFGLALAFGVYKPKVVKPVADEASTATPRPMRH